MKKIALCSLMVCLCSAYTVQALAGACAAKNLSYIGNQKPQDDEYLYETQLAYDKAVNGWAGSDHYDSGTARGFECDNNGCKGGDTVNMPAGHVFKGEIVDKPVRYECVRGRVFRGNWAGEDYWMPLNEDTCRYKDASEERVMDAGDVIYGKTFAQLSATCDIQDGTLPSWATDAVAMEEVALWKVECRKGTPTKKYCLVEQCREDKGYTLNRSTGRCEKTSACSQSNLGSIMEEVNCKQDSFTSANSDLKTGNICKKTCLKDIESGTFQGVWSIKVCPENTREVALSNPNKYTPVATGYKRCDVVDDPAKKSCKQSRSTAEGKACCDLPASEATYDAANDRCNCLNNKEFKIENGKGVCVAPQSTTANCKYKFKSTITCANGQYMSVDKETMVEAADCDEFNRLYGADLNKAMEVFGDLCAGVSPVYVPVHVGVDPVALGNATKTLDRFAASAKGEASGWKTADGKFNTTRLASDLTAGVVLGTVGGVVSGVVIKKKQVEKGFDALHCTVGGQKIADWGDEFSVGLQR